MRPGCWSGSGSRARSSGARMLAVVKDPAKRGVVLEDVPVPTVGPWEVLVRVRVAGICGSDQRIFNEVYPARRRRFIVGHEIAGEVVAVGERVTEVPLGASVAVEICIGCGICRHCKVGRVNLCEKLEELGVTVDGGHDRVRRGPRPERPRPAAGPCLRGGRARGPSGVRDPRPRDDHGHLGLVGRRPRARPDGAVRDPGDQAHPAGPRGGHRDPRRPPGDRPRDGGGRGREHP